MITKNKKAFTLIELLVVIAIIGILSTLVIVSLGDSRAKARDSKRLNDVRLMINALELYYENNNEYPPSLVFGDPLEANDIVYMSKVPENPTPRTDGNCPNKDYSYALDGAGTSYSLGFCLGSNNGSLSAGVHTASTDYGVGNAGLVGWWDFENDVLDKSGQNNHGTLTGGTYAPGVIGQAISLNGTSDFVNLNNTFQNITGSQQLTFAAWARSNVTNYTTRGRVMSFSRAGASSAFVLSAFNSSATWFGSYTSNGTTFTDANSSTAISAGNWFHLALTQKGNTVKVYINGNLTNTLTNASAPLISGPLNTYIGAHNDGGTPAQFFNGLIDDVRIYNRPLTDMEIQALYMAGQ
ncbi:MAG: prepilin-type N-terminal cleavage/methylation domain-containing protein [Patescibacteria group bacterium]|nr:MAG: prepilin-type N-terminal cleavage/methylation domain-containing protein [Patescibacteria group bacterium]